jgi:hypothetical protein
MVKRGEGFADNGYLAVFKAALPAKAKNRRMPWQMSGIPTFYPGTAQMTWGAGGAGGAGAGRCGAQWSWNVHAFPLP